MLTRPKAIAPFHSALAITSVLAPTWHAPFSAPARLRLLAGVAQWQSPSLPSWSCGFDSRRPLQLRCYFCKRSPETGCLGGVYTSSDPPGSVDTLTAVLRAAVAPGTAQESDHRHKAPAGSFGGAQKLPSGRWKAWYEVEGHRVTPGHTFPNKAQAD